MSMRRTCLITAVRPLLLGTLLLVAPGWGWAAPTIDAAAAERLRASLDYLGGLERFGLLSDTTLEVVLESGQKIQFDDTVVLRVQRPDKLHAARTGNVGNQELFYDGASLTLIDADAGYYATADAPPTLEGMLDFAREELDLVAPAGDLLYANAYEILMEGVQSGFVVGSATIAGVACDQLAFSAADTDFQVWVRQGQQPLPCKMVITSRDVLNAPQFTVVFREWDLAPELAEGTFRFRPPPDAAAIPFLAVEP